MAPPGWARPDLDAAVAAVAVQVNRDNVLQARNILLAEADRLDLELNRLIGGNYRIRDCGEDPVSVDATTGFNQRIDDLVGQCKRYNEDLRQAARALDATARSYGWTDEEIAASFQHMR
jgi:hypothetical protein